jgi:hypothetical protein
MDKEFEFVKICIGCAHYDEDLNWRSVKGCFYYTCLCGDCGWSGCSEKLEKDEDWTGYFEVYCPKCNGMDIIPDFI